MGFSLRPNVRRGLMCLRWVGVVLAGLMAATAHATPTMIAGTETSLVGSDERMISYRHQQHMWQTTDGITHVLINRGVTRDGTSLLLESSVGGSEWTSDLALPDTNLSSTSDGFLSGDDLFVTYSGALGQIFYSQLHYDPASRSWSPAGTEQVFSTAGIVGLTPAMAVDAQGRTWLTFTAWNLTTLEFSIKLMVKESGGAWNDTGFVFGTPDAVSNERSARPVATGKGMGIVYTVHQNIYWAQRDNRWPVTAQWPRSLIYPNQAPDTDPYGTHYSLVADPHHNVHLLSVDGGRLVYSRFLDAVQAWTTRIMTDDIDATYPKAVWSSDHLVVITNSESWLRVFQSADDGDTFTNTHLLTHPPAEDKVSYGRPRVESPATPVTNPIPVLQQYVDGVAQRALYFPVPVGAQQ